MTPAQRLVLALRERGVSQQHLSESLDVGRSAVSHWAKGRRAIDVELAKRIAEILCIRPAWLAFGDGEMCEPNAPLPQPPPPRTTKRRRAVAHTATPPKPARTTTTNAATRNAA